MILSILVSSILIGWLLSRIEIADLARTLRELHRPALLAFALFSLAGTGLRALRYVWLLAPHRVSTGGIVLVAFIRNLFVDLLPARLGSLSYIYFVIRRLGIPFEAAASSFMIGFVFDFLTLSPFLISALLLGGLGASVISPGPALAVSALFFLLLVFLLLRLAPLTSSLSVLAGRLLAVMRLDRKPWAEGMKEKLRQTADDIAKVKARRIEFPLFGLSLLIRFTKYAALFFLLFALLHSHGTELHDLNFPKIILGITGAEMSSALPIKGIGGFGTWESAWALAFQLLNFDTRLAVLTGIGVHLITNLFEYALGILSLIALASRSWLPRTDAFARK